MGTSPPPPPPQPAFDACAEMARTWRGDGTHGAAMMRSSPPFDDVDAVVSRSSRLGEI